jgi:reactive intermediate/imine deaminase
MEKRAIFGEARASWPYSQAVLVKGGHLLVCSGQVAFDAERDIVGKGDLRAQTRQALENLKRVLAEAGASMDDVVHLTIYLTEMREYPRLSDVARKYFKEPFPGMTLIGVKELAWPDLMVEIQAIAAVP